MIWWGIRQVGPGCFKSWVDGDWLAWSPLGNHCWLALFNLRNRGYNVNGKSFGSSIQYVSMHAYRSVMIGWGEVWVFRLPNLLPVSSVC